MKGERVAHLLGYSWEKMCIEQGQVVLQAVSLVLAEHCL
jgi:hypothetical protein